MINSRVELHGHLRVELFDAQGQLKQCFEDHNTITTAGHNDLADQVLDSPTTAKPTNMAIGTGTPTATALGTEISRVSNTSKTRVGNVVTIVANWAAGIGTGNITEAGTFDAASGGNMWMSSSFAAISKAAADTLQITWTLTT